MLIAIVAALAVNQIFYPQSATVNGVSVYLDGALWPDNTPIPWGNVNRDEQTNKTFNVTNFNTSQLTLTLCIVNITQPVGSTETDKWIKWIDKGTGNDLNGTILPAKESVQGNLTLTVPINAVPGDYTWTSWLNV